MNKKNRLTLSIIGVLFISLSLSASDYLNVKMRFFQGARKGEISPPEFVTSSFLQPTISATRCEAQGMKLWSFTANTLQQSRCCKIGLPIW